MNFINVMRYTFAILFCVTYGWMLDELATRHVIKSKWLRRAAIAVIVTLAVIIAFTMEAHAEGFAPDPRGRCLVSHIDMSRPFISNGKTPEDVALDSQRVCDAWQYPRGDMPWTDPQYQKWLREIHQSFKDKGHAVHPD